MTTQDTSLEYILPLYINPIKFIEKECDALQQVVGDIFFEIRRRKKLEGNLIKNLEHRVMHLNTELMNLPISYKINSLDRKIALEHDREFIELEKVKLQESTIKDIIELKKILWHYWLQLSKKQQFLK